MPFGLLLQDGANLLLEDGDSVLLIEQTDSATTASARTRDIRTDIRDLLVATSHWDGVYMSGPSGADDITQCWVMPAKEDIDSDDDFDGMLVIKGEIELWFASSDYDPDIADQEVDRMLAIASNAINGQSLAGITFPGFTRIYKTKWVEKPPPIRRIATVTYKYMTETWTGFNTDE